MVIFMEFMENNFFNDVEQKKSFDIFFSNYLFVTFQLPFITYKL